MEPSVLSMTQMERFHGATMGREKRVIELKEEVTRMKAELEKVNGGS